MCSLLIRLLPRMHADSRGSDSEIHLRTSACFDAVLIRVSLRLSAANTPRFLAKLCPSSALPIFATTLCSRWCTHNHVRCVAIASRRGLSVSPARNAGYRLISSMERKLYAGSADCLPPEECRRRSASRFDAAVATRMLLWPPVREEFTKARCARRSFP